MHGRGCAWQGGLCGSRGACMAGGMAGRVCIAGACVAGECAWQGAMRGRGACMAGVGGGGACVAEQTVTTVDGTHPTGTHSCLLIISNKFFTTQLYWVFCYFLQRINKYVNNLTIYL